MCAQTMLVGSSKNTSGKNGDVVVCYFANIMEVAIITTLIPVCHKYSRHIASRLHARMQDEKKPIHN